MVRYTCDLCGKELGGCHEHFVVKIEVFAAGGPPALAEADLDADHLEAVSQMLSEAGDDPDALPVPPATRQFRYDLCAPCRKRFERDPLSKEPVQKFDFSEN